jgi:hypothetical protein
VEAGHDEVMQTAGEYIYIYIKSYVTILCISEVSKVFFILIISFYYIIINKLIILILDLY